MASEKSKVKKKTITLTLDPDLYDRFSDVCRITCRSRSAVIDSFLKLWIKEVVKEVSKNGEDKLIEKFANFLK